MLSGDEFTFTEKLTAPLLQLAVQRGRGWLVSEKKSRFYPNQKLYYEYWQKPWHQRFPATRWTLDKSMPSEEMSASVSWVPRSPCLYGGQIGPSETSRTYSGAPHCSFKISPFPTQYIPVPYMNSCTAQLRNFCHEVFKFLPSAGRITFFFSFRPRKFVNRNIGNAKSSWKPLLLDCRLTQGKDAIYTLSFIHQMSPDSQGPGVLGLEKQVHKAQIALPSSAWESSRKAIIQ